MPSLLHSGARAARRRWRRMRLACRAVVALWALARCGVAHMHCEKNETRRSKCATRSHFLVLSYARTGSSFLVKMLNSHREICARGELMHPDWGGACERADRDGAWTRAYHGDASDARARIEGCRWDEYNAVIMNDESRQDDGETLPVDRGERGERFEVGLEGDARGVRSDEEDLGLGDVELEQLGAE